MERNSERNRYSNNDRSRRQNDQYNDFNQSYDQSRNQQWNRDENQPGYEGRNQSGDYGQYDRNRGEWSGQSRNRNDRRLESMGSLGNDWANRNDNDDYSNRGSYNSGVFGQSYNQSGYGQGGYNQGTYGNSGSDYRNQSDARGGSRDWNRLGSPSYEHGESGRNWWDKTKDEVSGWFGDENAQQRRDRDEQGQHRGKGPKGYTRTDERIREDVNERLTDDHSIDASEIEVDVKNGEVSLKGTVNSRHEKRRAEDIIENISGVKNVENHIKVQQDAGSVFGSSNQSNTERSEKSGDKKYGAKSVTGISNANAHN